MDFKLQAFGPFLHWLTLAILCIVPVVLAYIIYRLGGLPGAIARARNHPQAAAITVCGWMGIITLVLWPLALIWAYLKPGEALSGSATIPAESQASINKLNEVTQRLAALEARLAKQRAAAGG